MTRHIREGAAGVTCLALGVACGLLLTGCGTVLWETGLDERVYFDNRTGQTLELRLKDAPGRRFAELEIGPNRKTTLSLAKQGECPTRWVITDQNGAIVKDPGRICWHDTVTIP